jgi:hypothetical protein
MIVSRAFQVRPVTDEVTMSTLKTMEINMR